MPRPAVPSPSPCKQGRGDKHTWTWPSSVQTCPGLLGSWQCQLTLRSDCRLPEPRLCRRCSGVPPPPLLREGSGEERNHKMFRKCYARGVFKNIA